MSSPARVAELVRRAALKTPWPSGHVGSSPTPGIGAGDDLPVRTIGLIGGMSWESSSEYYRLLNETVRERRGGLHSAPCVMWSVDFAAIERLQRAGDWAEAARRLADLAARLQAAGAECLLLCTNTMHRVADEVQAAVDIPLLHIADATAERVKTAGLQAVGLLATRYTMQEDFYRGRLAARHGLRVLVPPEPDLTLVHEVIYDELCQGRVLDRSRDEYRRVIAATRGRRRAGRHLRVHRDRPPGHHRGRLGPGVRLHAHPRRDRGRVGPGAVRRPYATSSNSSSASAGGAARTPAGRPSRAGSVRTSRPASVHSSVPTATSQADTPRS